MKRSTLVLALLVGSASAHAGFVQPAPVTVDLDNRFASGDLVSARFADDEISFIGCGTRKFSDPAFPGSEFEFGFCQASDADDEQFTCFTEDPFLLDAAGRVSDFSFISFSWNEDGDCTRIGVSTQSFYIPEQTEGDGAFPGQGNGPGQNNGNGNGNGGGNP